MYGKFVLLLSISIAFSVNIKYKRALQVSHEKPQWEKWADAFLGQQSYDQVTSLVQLITLISEKYLSQCTPVILYDRQTEKYDNLVLQKLLINYPLAYIHGQITENYKIKVQNIIENQKTCISFIIFIEDVMKCKEIIGDQNYNKVVIVARSSQWRVFEFLGHERSQIFTNLLVIAKSDKPVTKNEESAYILYTHRLYIDAIGSNKPKILTSWINGNLTRPEVNLFPKKMTEGFAGHRFIVSYAHQPPFVIKRGRDREGDVIYDGIEVRLVQLLSKMFNFTTDFREATNDIKIGSSAAVMETIKANKANLGIGGSYMTPERVEHLGQWHSSDCASFVSLASTALPRYRAIMGPFHWTVWLTITFVYLFAIIPLVFSDKQTLRPLLKNPEEIENMFWYVFGTFTNCFTFTGKGSWYNTKKITTRLLIGFYWVFTIIITACYTGSIIAFVTLPVYPSVIDTIDQLIGGRYQIGLLDKGGWQNWYENTTDKDAIRLLKKADYVPTVEAGLKNMTKAFFWPYAFLGSHAQLDYIVRTNFTTTSKRSLLHISKECFVPYYVSLIYQKNAIYKDILNKGVLRAYEFGFLKKLKNDVEWLTMRSATGQLLAVKKSNNNKY